jgi:hypothetical protein
MLQIDPFSEHLPNRPENGCALYILNAANLDPVGNLAVEAKPGKSEVVATD